MGDGRAAKLVGSRKQAARAAAEDLLDFLDASPTPWHAVAELSARFSDAGFTALDEGTAFSITPGDRVFFTRNGSALAAVIAGTAKPSETGFLMVAAHTDSPALKVKPSPECRAQGLVHLTVEIYGGPILATWMDRDLSLAGRAIVGGDGRPEARLFRTKPVVALPNLAIHLNRQVNDEGLKLNAQTQMTPILAAAADGAPEAGAVKRLLGAELGVDPELILDFDAILADAQPASFAGTGDELIRAGRLDDLEMCHGTAAALLAVAGESSRATRVAIFYDNEEVGSETTQGARSNFIPNLLERIALAMGDDRPGYLAALTKSMLVSADNAHACHPGYADKHEPRHAPVLNGGPVVKSHASRAYATDAMGAARFMDCCRKADVPAQRFVNRSDAKSGTTIGSMTAAQLGVLTVDVGNAQYAMHSIRETAGSHDPYYMIEAMKAFYAG